MRKFLAFILFLTSFSAYAYEAPFYFGMDANISKITFQERFGGNFAPKHIPGINHFVGLNLNQYICLELGYHYARYVRVNTLREGDWAAGFTVPRVLEPITFRTTATFKGPNINLLVMAPIFKSVPIRFFAGIGASQTKAIVSRKTMQYSAYIGRATRILESCRTIKRLTLGANYFFDPDFAIRFSTIFSNTRKFNQFVCDEDHPFICQEVKANNGITYSVGLRWGF